jgi:hypothetical protein
VLITGAAFVFLVVSFAAVSLTLDGVGNVKDMVVIV